MLNTNHPMLKQIEEKLLENLQNLPSNEFKRLSILLERPTVKLIYQAMQPFMLQSEPLVTSHVSSSERKTPPNSLPEPTIGEIANQYIAASCPDLDDQQKDKKRIQFIQGRLDSCLPYWRNRRMHEITVKSWKEYRKWRAPRARTGNGDRIIDYERIVLTAMFRWAISEELCKGPNPFDISEYPTFAKNPKNCRDMRPQNAEELNRIANHLFETKKGEVLAWQFLLECLTGCRTSEILRLRWDAQNSKQPGYISEGVLWIERSKKGVRNYIRIYPALQECLTALRNWHQERHPKSPWFFPSCHYEGAQPVCHTALTAALKRVVVDLKLEGNRTSHGCRAYRVCVLRSEGWDDNTIALELGQRSGPGLIVRVYGESTPEKLGYYTAEGKAVWQKWLPATSDPKNGPAK